MNSPGNTGFKWPGEDCGKSPAYKAGRGGSNPSRAVRVSACRWRIGDDRNSVKGGCAKTAVRNRPPPPRMQLVGKCRANGYPDKNLIG